MNPMTWPGCTRNRPRHHWRANMPPYAPTLISVTASVAHAQGNGRGGGFFTLFSASASARFTSMRFGCIPLASASLAAA
jgi:hypothetical protein